jgi:hypothetical protein
VTQFERERHAGGAYRRGGALVLWHNPLRTGGHWCSGVIKPGWRRIRKLRGGKELTQEENGEGVLDGFMLKQRVRRNGRIQPTVMKNGRGGPVVDSVCAYVVWRHVCMRRLAARPRHERGGGGRTAVCRGRHRQRKEVPIGGPRWQRCGTLAHGTTHVVRRGKGFTGGTRRFK